MATPEGAEQYAAIVPAHAPAMLRVAAALVGPSEAEDAVQEAAVRAWQAWPSLRDQTAVRAWLLRITVNVCREWRRGGRGHLRAHTQDLGDAEQPALALLEADFGTSDHTGLLDLRAAINELPEDLRIVVVLRYYSGMDASTIGALLNLPAGTVRSRLHRAIQLLRTRLAPSNPRPASGSQLPRMGGAQ